MPSNASPNTVAGDSVLANGYLDLAQDGSPPQHARRFLALAQQRHDLLPILAL